MKYIFTKHAKQRRQHLPIKTDEELIRIMGYLDTFYNFSELENGKYSFREGGKAAVFSKESNQITLITIRGIDTSTAFDAEIVPTLKKVDPEVDAIKGKRKAARNKKNKWMQYYPAIFKETHTGTYDIFFPDILGCVSGGKSFEEAITAAKCDIALHLTGMISNGLLMPVIDLNRCKDVAKGHILVMVRPQKELLIVKE